MTKNLMRVLHECNGIYINPVIVASLTEQFTMYAYIGVLSIQVSKTLRVIFGIRIELYLLNVTLLNKFNRLTLLV